MIYENLDPCAVIVFDESQSVNKWELGNAGSIQFTFYQIKQILANIFDISFYGTRVGVYCTAKSTQFSLEQTSNSEHFIQKAGSFGKFGEFCFASHKYGDNMHESLKEIKRMFNEGGRHEFKNFVFGKNHIHTKNFVLF